MILASTLDMVPVISIPELFDAEAVPVMVMSPGAALPVDWIVQPLHEMPSSANPPDPPVPVMEIAPFTVEKAALLAFNPTAKDPVPPVPLMLIAPLPVACTVRPRE